MDKSDELSIPKKIQQSISTLSKKRYEEIKQILLQKCGISLGEEILADIRNIMNFDPSVSKYTPELGKKIVESRNRLAQERGVSTYITGGGKAFYEKRKKERASHQTLMPHFVRNNIEEF